MPLTFEMHVTQQCFIIQYVQKRTVCLKDSGSINEAQKTKKLSLSLSFFKCYTVISTACRLVGGPRVVYSMTVKLLWMKVSA